MLSEAIRLRHSVRRFQNKPLEQKAVDDLQSLIREINIGSNLHIQLVLNEPKAFMSPLARYGKFENVKNYIVMAGPSDMYLGEKVGYFGEAIVLRAQANGLNTCWVGLTYSKVKGAFTLEKGEKVACVIAIGYGATQGVQHKLKKATDISNLGPQSPEWFRDGIDAVLLCPTAVNQQKFYFKYNPLTGKVAASFKRSVFGYNEIDLGIARLHFEIGSLTGPFIWE